MTLENEIEQKAKEIRTEEYSMSIGEALSLYKDKEIDIHPEFQRFYRWSDLQKTKLIESILLGIPVPPIYVSQRDDGVWDVIDGLQRLSTLFEFMGELRDENDDILPPKILMGTKYLPSLEDKIWKDEYFQNKIINKPLKLEFKRSKLHFVIVKKESDPDAKYELFQRLNTLGSRLSDQEVRNCMIVMYDRDFFEWIKNIAEFEPFQNCIALSEKSMEQQYDLELLLRFFAYKNSTISEIKKSKDVNEFLTEKMLEYSKSDQFNKTIEKDIFEQTFSILNNILGEDSFKRYNSIKGRFEGKFLISAFEVIAIGLGKNYENWNNYEKSDLIDKIKSIWSDKTFINNSGSGSNVTTRLPILLPYGERLFENEN